MRFLPLAAPLVDVETTQPDSVGLAGPALDQRQCRAFDSGVPLRHGDGVPVGVSKHAGGLIPP